MLVLKEKIWKFEFLASNLSSRPQWRDTPIQTGITLYIEHSTSSTRHHSTSHTRRHILSIQMKKKKDKEGKEGQIHLKNISLYFACVIFWTVFVKHVQLLGIFWEAKIWPMQIKEGRSWRAEYWLDKRVVWLGLTIALLVSLTSQWTRSIRCISCWAKEFL